MHEHNTSKIVHFTIVGSSDPHVPQLHQITDIYKMKSKPIAI